MTCFRPLAGICCFMTLWGMAQAEGCEFPSPCGDMLFQRSKDYVVWKFVSFRPLAGICCFRKEIIMAINTTFPSPCGDMLFRAALQRTVRRSDVSVPLRGYVVSRGSHQVRRWRSESFRPLAGICCFGKKQ